MDNNELIETKEEVGIVSLFDEEMGAKMKEMFKDNKPEPIIEKKKSTKSKTVENKSVRKEVKDMNKEVKPVKEEVKAVKEEIKEVSNDFSYSKFTTRIESDGRVAILSRNLAMAVAYLTAQRFSCVKNDFEDTKDKFKNKFIFENTKSLKEAIELIESNKKKLRQEEREKRFNK